MKLKVDTETIRNEIVKISIIFNAFEKIAFANLISIINTLEKNTNSTIKTLID